MGLLKKVGKAFGKITGLSFALKLTGQLLTALLPKPKIPKSIESSGTQYNANARVNESRLGDTKAVVYGQARVWPAYASVPWKSFDSNDQVLHAYLHITVGEADVVDIKLGDTSAANFPGFQVEILQPGEDMTLFLPNVYTCPEVQQIDMPGGAMDNTSPDDPHKVVVIKGFTDNDSTFENISLTEAKWTVEDEGFFADLLPGDIIYLYETLDGNNGSYPVLAISDDNKTIYLSGQFGAEGSADDAGFFLQKRWSGPFPACPPGATVDTIAVDFVFNALQDGDKPNDEASVDIVIGYRPIDDAGNVIFPGTWTETTETFTGNVNRPLRFTRRIALSDEMRCEVRVWRETYEHRDNENPSSACQWVGLKGEIVAKAGDHPASDPDSTRIAVQIRSSGLLSNASENAVNCLVRRKVSIYESGGWTSPQFTRNPVWAEADWLLNQSNGAVTTAKLDTDDLVAQAAGADEREDTFDGVFDRQVSLWEGAQTILRVARAKPIFNPLTQLYGIYRDEPADPIVMLCDGFNARLGSDSIKLPDEDTVTGVSATFMDPLLWVEREGPTVGTDDDVRKSRVMGLTSWQKAFEEATFQIRDLYYRNQTVSADVEMDGLIPIHGNRALVASAMKGWGHSGEVIQAVDSTTLQVWPAPTWTPGMDHYIYLQDADGTPVGPIAVTQGLSENYLLLESDPGITIRDGGGWKTLFAFGHDGDSGENPNAPRVAIVQQRSANSLRTSTLDLLFDHPYVHEDAGTAPEDPYDTIGTIPDLTITGLTAEQEITGDILLAPDGAPLLAPTDDYLIGPGGVAGGVLVNVSWDAEPGATSYQLRWKYIGIPGWHYASTIGTTLTFSPPANGSIQVRVKALSTTYVGPEATTVVVIDAYP